MFINKSETPVETFTSDFYSKIGMMNLLAGILIIGIASLFIR
jgi:hypothetical protein